MRGMAPNDPISAVTHPDPYPYYAALRERGPLVFDPSLKLWVAAQARSVMAVLGQGSCRVRPVAEPVPRAIEGTAAGSVFGRLVRMSDGDEQAAHKQAIGQGLSGVDLAGLQAFASQQVPDQLATWAVDVPVHCIAHLLGWPDASRAQLSRWMRDFVACLSPLSSAQQLAMASDAARSLIDRMQALVQACVAAPGSLVQRIQQGRWHSADALVANLIGLLSQTHDATAGLIGNCIVALLQRPDVLEQLRAEPARVTAFVREVSRFDPSVQNTRRFVAEPTTLCGVELQPGDAILVLLAAASRDGALHPDADRFDMRREPAELIGFGAGRHACPGQSIAQAIAAGAMTQLLRGPMLSNADAIRWTYRPSVNARIPVFSD